MSEEDEDIVIECSICGKVHSNTMDVEKWISLHPNPPDLGLDEDDGYYSSRAWEDYRLAKPKASSKKKSAEKS